LENPKLRKGPLADKLPHGFQSTFLDGLTPAEIKILLKAAKQETVSLNQVVERGGDPATRMWLLLTGRVAVYKLAENGKKLFLGWRVPGDTFGVQTILREPARYILTVEAVQESSILAWDLPSSRALVLRCPGLSKAAMLVAAGYFDDLIDVLGTFAFQAAEQRLARVLVKGARQLGRKTREGIELDLTNEQLAVAAHMTLFTATRKLCRWKDQGFLKKRRGMIVLRSVSIFEKLLQVDDIGDRRQPC
jgi:CRP/FNR family transcriptional regulator